MTKADQIAQAARSASPIEALRELLAVNSIRGRLNMLQAAKQLEVQGDLYARLLESYNRRAPLAWEAAWAAVEEHDEKLARRNG